MLTFIVPLSSLRKIAPEQVAAFERVCEAGKIHPERAVEALAGEVAWGWTREDGVGDIFEATGDIEYENEIDRERLYDDLVTAFSGIDAAVLTASAEVGKPIGVQCQNNNDEMEGFGSYIRLRTVDQSHPFVKANLDLFEIKELTVYQSKEAWAEEN